jgi:hypothetical protein
MKKALAIAFVLLALLAGHVYAGQSVREVISETTLTSTNKYVDSGTIDIRGLDKVSFFVNCDTTTDTVTAEVTVEISYDGIHWLQASFRDFAGGATLQTSEDINQGYYLWLDPQYITAPYARISVSIGNPDELGAADSNTVSVKIVTEN